MKINYDQFVKYYYYILTTRLRKFKDYNGVVNYVNYVPKILEAKEYHTIYATNNFLPNWDINMNAPTELFENYLEFLVDTHPYLSPCVYNRDLLKQAYLSYTKQPKVDFNEFLNEIISIGIEIDKELGVLI